MGKFVTRWEKIRDNIGLELFNARAVAGHNSLSPSLGGHPTFDRLTHKMKSLEDIYTDGYGELMSASVVIPFPQRSLLPLFYSPTHEKQQR